MRIGLLTQWFDPEPGPAALPGVLARGLVDRGHDVTVVTGFPNYPTGLLAPGYRIRPHQRERVQGVDIVRVPLVPTHSPRPAMRLLNYGTFGLSAATLGLPALLNQDALWVNYSPVTVAPALLLASRLSGTPSVVHVLDLWPDTLVASGVDPHSPVGRASVAGAGAVARRMYEVAHSVAYISPSVGPLLADRGVPEEKLAYAPMWADESNFRPGAGTLRDELGLGEDAVVLLYAGAIGEAQGLDVLVDACAAIDDERFVCAVAGSGTHREALERRAEESGAPVRFIGRVPQERMSALLASADAAFISLNDDPHSCMTMPSKTQATLAAGRPIVAAAAGDVARVVRESGAGWVVPPADPAALVEAIRTLCLTTRPELAERGRAGRTYYDSVFSEKTGIDRIERLLAAAAAGERTTA